MPLEMKNSFDGKKFLLSYYLENFIRVRAPRFLKIHNPKKFENKWHELKQNFHLNEKKEILIVGNGPSLNAQDLESLSFMPSIASNKIFLLFDQTQWRPTYLTICDTLLSYKLQKSNFGGIDRILCASNVYFMFTGASPKRLPWKSISLKTAWQIFSSQKKFFPDPVNSGFYEGFSITNQNIQLAIWLGARQIYLIGMDHFYEEHQCDAPGRKLVHQQNNHFSKDYRAPGEIVNNAPIEKMNDAYTKTRIMAEANGVEIYNISRKTGLNVFSRIETEEFIEKNS